MKNHFNGNIMTSIRVQRQTVPVDDFRGLTSYTQHVHAILTYGYPIWNSSYRGIVIRKTIAQVIQAIITLTNVEDRGTTYWKVIHKRQ